MKKFKNKSILITGGIGSFGKKIPLEIYNNFFSIMFHPSKLPLFRGGEALFKSKL